LSLFSKKMARLVQVLLAYLATFGEFSNEIYAFCQSA